METEPDSDEDLMIRYGEGEVASFDELYRRYKGRLYRFFLRQVKNSATADELFQDVWTKVIHARQSYRPSAQFSTWLFRIAHNRLVDHYRRSRFRLVLPAASDPERDADPLIPDKRPGPERQVMGQQQMQRLLQLIGGLPQPQQEAFLLKEEGNLSVAEIAQVTGVGQETAKSRLRYAMASLRQGLEETL